MIIRKDIALLFFNQLTVVVFATRFHEQIISTKNNLMAKLGSLGKLLFESYMEFIYLKDLRISIASFTDAV